jgi:hypothetical protein
VDIKNAKNGVKTTKIRLKQVQGLKCKENETSWAKTKKTGLNREKTLRWKDLVVNLRKRGGFLAKTRGQGEGDGSDLLDHDPAAGIAGGWSSAG